MRINTPSKSLRVTLQVLLASLIFITIALSSAYAQQNDTTDWWFDVEVLLFKYHAGPEEVQEQFSTEIDIDFEHSDSSLFLTQLMPDLRWLYLALPICEGESSEHSFDCRPQPLPLEPISIPSESLESIANVPVIMDGFINPYPETIQFLPESERELIELYKNIRWDKTTTPLFHSVWRQPVMVGEENATPIRILAGKNLTYGSPDVLSVVEDIEESVDNTDKVSQVDLITQIQANLAAPDTVIYADQIIPIREVENTEPQFELDGLLNVFIRYVNGVPYLHIDAHMGFYTLENGILLPHEFKQRRRIISQQVHYFDHPYFGMIVELRRYKRPIKEVPAENEDLYENR